MKKIKILIFTFSSSRFSRELLSPVDKPLRDKQYHFRGHSTCECIYDRPKSANVRSTEHKWVIRVFARTNAGSELPTNVLQHAINYANWSSGYRSGTAMHVNVRKDICFPSACIRFVHTDATHTQARTNTYVRTICTHGIHASQRNTRVRTYMCAISVAL